jgi:hypothetical protein
VKPELKQLPIPTDHPLTELDCDYRRAYEARFDGGRYSVFVTHDNLAGPAAPPDHRWHISVAGEHDIPPWPAMAAIVHEARPGVPFALPLPPQSQWLNFNRRVLHVYEVRDELLTAQWAFEGRGDRPT